MFWSRECTLRIGRIIPIHIDVAISLCVKLRGNLRFNYFSFYIPDVIVFSDFSDDQRRIVTVYNAFSVTAFCVTVSYVILFRVFKLGKSFFFATNKEIGDDGGIPYRGLFGQPGYIPLVIRPELAEPVLCTNVKVY